MERGGRTAVAQGHLAGISPKALSLPARRSGARYNRGKTDTALQPVRHALASSAMALQRGLTMQCCARRKAPMVSSGVVSGMHDAYG